MTKEIETLLEKYFEGNTSLSEERRLQEYFNSENVDDSLQKYKHLFVFFKEASNEKSSSRKFSPKSKNRTLYRQIAVAATFLPIIFVIGYLIKEQREQKQAELVYQKVKSALELVSMNYNKGTKKMEYLKEFDATTNKIIHLNNIK